VQVRLLHSHFKASPEHITGIHFPYFVRHLRAARSDIFYFKLDFFLISVAVICIFTILDLLFFFDRDSGGEVSPQVHGS
jgi:hypothetical protein